MFKRIIEYLLLFLVLGCVQESSLLLGQTGREYLQRIASYERLCKERKRECCP